MIASNPSQSESRIAYGETEGEGSLFWYFTVILIILGGIALYEYPNFLLVQNRADGRDGLQVIISKQGEYFQLHQKYATSLGELGYENVRDFAVNSPRGFYKLLLTDGDGTFYTLAAQPQEEQNGDTLCAVLTYNSKGNAKGASGSNGPSCW
ncbi:MAG: hypothetical protein HQL56_06285 [Magnetococcales bacterium]|nr:hypothetical protein [Magnetococcales bacterium]